MPDIREPKNPLFVSLQRYSEIPDEVNRFSRSKFAGILRGMFEEGIASETGLAAPVNTDKRDLLLAHGREYVDDLLNLRQTKRTIFAGLPLEKEYRDLFMLNSGATIRGLNLALENGISMVIGGGAIHAHHNFAEGQCFVNDVAIALLRARTEGKIARGIFVSCDAHHPSGVVSILSDNPELFILSIFEEDNFPFNKSKGDMDVPLCSMIGDQNYLALLSDALNRVLDEHKPEVVVFLASADPFKEDLGSKLNLTKEGLEKRDEMVIGEAFERGIPIVTLLGASNSPKIENELEIHLNTARAVKRFALRSKT
jgi:acetoin utilization deacetylase AcuC-like enzyme